MSTKVTIKSGKADKYDYHVYHDVFDDETVYLEVYARHVKMEYNEQTGMVMIGLHKNAALAIGIVTKEEWEDVDLKLPPVGDSVHYKCTNAHADCGNKYPGEWCPNCEARE